MVGTMKIINYDVSCVHCGNNYRARIASGFVPSEMTDEMICKIEGENHCDKCGNKFVLEKDECIEKSVEPVPFDSPSMTFRKVL